MALKTVFWSCQSRKFSGRGAVMGVAGRVLPQHHQPVRLVKGQRAKQHGIHHTEDGGVGTDAKRQNHGGERRETRGAGKHAGGVT